MRYIYTLLFVMLLFPFSGYSQINRLKHGEKLYEKYDYIDAQKVYKKVVERGYASAQIYADLGDSYYFQSNYSEALKWYEKLFNEFPESIDATHYVRAIQSFKSQGRSAERSEERRVGKE